MAADTIIHLDHVWAAYRIEPVLQDIDWHWQQGQQWAILGGNGAGKSAIADLISDRLRPQRGRVVRAPYLDPDRDILQLSFELQRELIQHDLRFDDSELRPDAFDVGTTVRQLVLQGAAADQRFTEIAARCRIGHILDRGIRFISTGESRKALLARALFNPPQLLILDNPFEGLDHASRDELQQLIEELLTSDLPVLLLIKQASEVPWNVTHVLALEAGRVQRCGSRSSVLAAGSGADTASPIGAIPAPVNRPYSVDHNQPLVAMRDVEVSYNEQPVLRALNWQFDWGQHCCIAGPNGAGKSTLLSLLTGDNHKAYGQDITLFGVPRGSGESIWELKQKFGMVSTQMQLNHSGRTRVAEVVASGLYDSVGLYRECGGRDRDRALQWLRLTGLEAIARHPFRELSFGQQRLAMLARAMVKSPLILILDEPCIGLDDYHRGMILALLDRIAAAGDCHILYVSHTPDEMPACINQQLTLVPHPDGGYTGEVVDLRPAPSRASPDGSGGK